MNPTCRCLPLEPFHVQEFSLIGNRVIAVAAILLLGQTSASAISCDLLCMMRGAAGHSHMHGNASSSNMASHSAQSHHGPGHEVQAQLNHQLSSFRISLALRSAQTRVCEPALLIRPRLKADDGRHTDSVIRAASDPVLQGFASAESKYPTSVETEAAGNHLFFSILRI